MQEKNVMRAWQVDELGSPAKVITLDQRERPAPGEGEVQVKVNAAGLGLPDVFMCKGEYAYSPPIPFTPGQEVCGVITAVGEGCTAQVGQRVMGVTTFYSGYGGFAEYCLALDQAVYPVFDGMSDTEAAIFCIPYHTAYIGLALRAQIQPSEVLLVYGGAGGSGSAAIQLGRALGATVVAAASTADKRAYCKTLGADYVIDTSEKEFSKRLLESTDGRAVDVVFDPVGGDCFKKSIRCTANKGRLLAVGFASGSWGELPTRDLVNYNCSVMGVYVGAYKREQMLEIHEQLRYLYQAGKIAVQIDEVASFDNLPQSLDKVEKRETNGKIVLTRP